MKLKKLSYDVLDAAHKSNTNLFLVGAPGIAKTTYPKQWCADTGKAYVLIHCPIVDAPDVGGVVISAKDAEGNPVTYSTKPEWLVRVEGAIKAGYKEGVIMLDELPAGELLTIKALASLLSERGIGRWKVPEGWSVWCTGNRPEDKAGAARLPAHVTQRVSRIDIEPDDESFGEWAASVDMDWRYVGFSKFKPSVVFNTTPVDDPSQPRCNPRTFTFAHNFHKQLEVNGVLPTDDATQAIIRGFIGPAAAELFAFLQVREHIPSIEDILASPLTAKLPTAERPDARFAVMQLCVYNAKPTNVDTIFKYVKRLPADMAVTAAAQLAKKKELKGNMMNSPTLIEWISEDPELIARILG